MMKIMPLQKQRTKCPFFGFFLASGTLIDQEGNQCPFKDGYSPCHMQIQGPYPEWLKCSYNYPNNSVNIERFLDNIKIFPSELHPKEAREWEGIPLRKWYDYIILGKEIES